MAQGSELGVVTGMVPECSWRVQRWSGVREWGWKYMDVTAQEWNALQQADAAFPRGGGYNGVGGALGWIWKAWQAWHA